MFCNHCGKSITEKSVYCSHCGTKQSDENLLQVENNEENSIENKTEKKIKLFIDENKSFIVFYLFWFILHLILLVTEKNGCGCGARIWPFGDCDCTQEYHFSDFLFYLIVPIVIWGIWKLIGKDIKKAIDENN